MPRRVLHLIDTGGPGGAETVFRDIVVGLRERGWEATATVPLEDWLFTALRDGGIEPVIVSTRGSFDGRYLRQLVALARSGVTLIHAHLFTSSLYGSVAGIIARVPVVCTFHGSVDVAADRFRNVKFRIINDVARSRIVFVSESLRRSFLTTVPLTAARTTVIHNGIDWTQFNAVGDVSLRRELSIADGEILIGAVGNVRPSKAYDVLLRAAAVLCRESPRYRFAVVGQCSDGSGGLYEELRRLHASLGLGDRFRFIGFREDVPAVMRNLDVYVSSSTTEGFSLTTVEAMASGVPVVATRSGGPEEIVEHGVSGILVPPNDPTALARAIHQLSVNEEYRSRLADAARRRAVERFTLGGMVDAYEALYEQCMRQGNPVSFPVHGDSRTRAHERTH